MIKKKPTSPSRSVRIPENIDAVRRIVVVTVLEDPKKFCLMRFTLRLIFHSCKAMVVQLLTDRDLMQRKNLKERSMAISAED